jgi:endoribonuclease LACTB2
LIRPVPLQENVASFATLTPTLPPATHTQSYALGGREVLLVEPATPYDDERAEWLAWARGLESQGRAIVGIVLTHHHPDHAGGAAFFSQELGVPLWAHAITETLLPGVPIARRLDEGDVILLDGPEPMHLSVLHTPGHAAGHVCLHAESDGVLICGDMMASVGTILIHPEEGDMQRYLQELGRLERLGARVALPAHGDPVREPDVRFRAYIAHRLMREGLVLAALAKLTGGGTLDELLPIAYADTNPAIFPIARWSLEAHLIKLLREHRVERNDDKYRLAGAS